MITGVAKGKRDDDPADTRGGEGEGEGVTLAGTANSSLVETPSGCPATSCGRV